MAAAINLFLAPHSDDESLYGAYIIQRIKPIVVVCTDGTTHQERFGISAKTRRGESQNACKILGVKVIFLGIPEDKLTREKLIRELTRRNLFVACTCSNIGLVFAPTKTGGQPQHDLISDVAREIYRGVLYYGTYSRENFSPTGEMAIYPIKKEEEIKNKVLECYKSQHAINKPHFDAVRGVPEYLSFKQ